MSTTKRHSAAGASHPLRAEGGDETSAAGAAGGAAEPQDERPGPSAGVTRANSKAAGRKRAVAQSKGRLMSPQLAFVLAAAAAAYAFRDSVPDLIESMAMTASSAATHEESLESPGGRRFTVAELAKYKGKNGGPVYLAILGQVFDVTKGRRHYEEGKGYACFAGADATRSFISGEFEGDEVTSDVSGLGPHDMKGLIGWRDFYHSDYTYLGFLPDERFYDVTGAPTAALREVFAGAKESERLDAIRKANEKQFPPCHMKWTQKEGGVVWCNEGYPRLTVEYIDNLLPKDVDTERKTRERCACFQAVGWSDMRKVYKGCKPDEQRCQVLRD